MSDLPKKHPTVGPQATIDKLATALVGAWFAQGWIVQPLQPNYHEDYIVERVDAGELSGAKISVQQKGHASMRFIDGFWPERIKTKHLRYYAEKLAMPGFLFVVDTTKKKGYYLFVQQWLDQNVAPAALKNQKKLSLPVPLANDLEDQPKFLGAVRDALAYMAKKFPGSVEDAIQGDIRKLAAIDPRWDVKLDVVNAAKHYTLNPKEDLSGLMKVSGPNVEKMKDHYEYGKPVTLDGSAMKVEGFPLFDYLVREKGAIESVTIRPTKPFKIEFNFWSDGPDGFRLTLPGSITKGKVGLSFVSNLSGTPLHAEMKIPLAQVTAPTGEGTLLVNFTFQEWEQKSITSLPYFDKLRGFAEAIVQKKLIHHEVTVDGNRVTAGTLGNAKDPTPFEYAAAVIENLAKARAIATKLGVQIVLPNLDHLGPADFETVDETYNILLGSSSPRKGVGFKVSLTLHRKHYPAADAIATLESLCTQGGMTLNKKSQETVIYGTRVMLGDVTYSINPVKLVVPEPGRSDFVAGRVETAPAIVESLPESLTTITVATAVPGT